MARLILSNRNRQQVAEATYASKITWRKALNSMGFCQFDLALTDTYAQTQFLNAGTYVHIFSDSADTSSYANADFGGVLVNDFTIKPKDGVITVSAAGLADVFNVSVVNNTITFTNVDAGTIMSQLIQNSDNASFLPLTAYTVDAGGALVSSLTIAQLDQLYPDLQQLASNFGVDFDVRPDFTYGILTRQGYDRPDLVIRYGLAGNIQVDSEFTVANSELFNQVYAQDNSGSGFAYVVNQTSVQFYGHRTIVIENANENGYAAADALTIAQVELVKRAFPPSLLEKVTLVDTPLLPFSKLNLGDRVTFEAVGLPMLESFNGLQRILSIEYDDTKRTMTLNLGNALYLVQRNRLHEVRLYGDNG